MVVVNSKYTPQTFRRRLTTNPTPASLFFKKYGVVLKRHIIALTQEVGAAFMSVL